MSTTKDDLLRVIEEQERSLEDQRLTIARLTVERNAARTERDELAEPKFIVEAADGRRPVECETISRARLVARNIAVNDGVEPRVTYEDRRMQLFLGGIPLRTRYSR